LLTRSENDWVNDAACKDLVTSPEDDIFFNDVDSVVSAKDICGECPVRRLCLEYALNNGIHHGTWGGVDENELRRDQSLGADGKRHDWQRPIRCPDCGPNSTRFLEVVKYHRTKTDIRCTNCNLQWPTKKTLRKRKVNW
jgi:hypothetical protein